MSNDFLFTKFGKLGTPVHRLGFSATYWPGKKTIYRALDAGVNCFFFFGIDRQLIKVLKEVMKGKREKFVIVTGAYNLLIGHPNLRRSLEKRLRQLGTEYIDAFMFLGVSRPQQFPEQVREEFYRFREEGTIRGVGMSCHDRRFAGELAASNAIDVLMIRYNAAHRGAENDIFPFLQHEPAVIGYTATRWGDLLRRPQRYPKHEPLPTAGQCYRFVLTNPHVHVCLTAPTTMEQFEENISAVTQGPLNTEEMSFMKRFGDIVHARKSMFEIRNR